MTSDRIRWCMKCNLMVTSRKCPRCRSDVYNLHLEKGAKLAPLFNNHIRIIRSKIDDNYGPGCGELLIPDDRTSMFEISNGRRNIIVDGGAVGTLDDDWNVSLNATGLGRISSKITKNYLRCDHDSSYFVTKGRNLMVTGITGHSDGLSEGDIVAILDEKGVPIAEGMMKLDETGLDSERGVAVKIRDNSHPRIYDGQRKSTWAQTIEANGISLGALIGDTVKKIQDMQMSYGFPIFAEISSDIVSEANLILALEAGYKPKVLVREDNDFIRYLIQKHGLDTISELPERYFLITEERDAGDGNIHHSPTAEWDPSTVWLYIMLRAEPFDSRYLKS